MKYLELKIIPPFQVLILGLAMWWVHDRFPWLHIHTGNEYLLSRILLLLALGIFVIAVYQFYKHQTTVNPVRLHKTSALITNGIYTYSRNPIYLADVIILVAWVVYLGNWLNLALVPVLVWSLTRFQIEPEEAMLAVKFPEEFARYHQQTNRWFGWS